MTETKSHADDLTLCGKEDIILTVVWTCVGSWFPASPYRAEQQPWAGRSEQWGRKWRSDHCKCQSILHSLLPPNLPHSYLNMIKKETEQKLRDVRLTPNTNDIWVQSFHTLQNCCNRGGNAFLSTLIYLLPQFGSAFFSSKEGGCNRGGFVHIIKVQVIGVWWWIFGSRSLFKVTPEVWYQGYKVNIFGE